MVDAVEWTELDSNLLDGFMSVHEEVLSSAATEEEIERKVESVGFFKKEENGDASLYIKTLEGVMKVSCGDFIIKGVAGEYYPCKPEIFKETYEEV